MKPSNSDLVIGVDGGGTKTVAWVAPRDDWSNTIILGRGQSGPGNPRAVGFEAAQRSIQEAIALALGNAGRAPGPVAAACFGLAGAGRPAEQTSIEQWALESQLASHVRVCGDAEPILAAGSENCTGVALISGTGSLAWGRNAQGETARSGGWGYLLGDEGSAYWIALEGLRVAVRSVDRRHPDTQLLPAFLEALEATSPSQLIEIIYAPDMTRERIAALAQVVFAQSHDPIASHILDRAAEELAQMVVSLAGVQLRLPTDYALALVGGVLTHQTWLVDRMLEKLRASGHAPGSVTFVSDPVQGAVSIARRLLKSVGPLN